MTTRPSRRSYVTGQRDRESFYGKPARATKEERRANREKFRLEQEAANRRLAERMAKSFAR